MPGSHMLTETLVSSYTEYLLNVFRQQLVYLLHKPYLVIISLSFDT